jgi:hypothetical protein
LPSDDVKNLQTRKSSREEVESLADELRKTQDVRRMQELVMLLEEAIFNRQQDLVLNAENIEKHKIKDEEQAMRQVLELMLEVKVKKLGFPDIR